MRVSILPSPGAAAASILILAACSGPPEEHALFEALEPYCGQAFGGQVTRDEAAMDALSGEPLVLHLRECTGNTLSMPLHIGNARGLILVLTRTRDGLELRHRVLRPDGSPARTDGYGGSSGETSTPLRAIFPPDGPAPEIETPSVAGLVTGAGRTHQLEWQASDTILVYGFGPGGIGADAGTLRIAFDLSTPVSPPPPPWGEEG